MIMGPDTIELDGIFTDGCLTLQPLTISRWVAQVASRFDTLGVPERLGLMLLCTRYLRVRYVVLHTLYSVFILILNQWFIHKSADHYREVPDWLKPTSIQLQMPHEMWIDLIPW